MHFTAEVNEFAEVTSLEARLREIEQLLKALELTPV